MIRIILKGGLGNQMFQYALGKSIALQKGQQLVLDSSFIDNRIPLKDFTIRDYELDLFDVEEQTTKLFQNTLINRYASYPLLRVSALFNKNYILEGPDPYNYDKRLLENINDLSDVILEGYFNNYKYFEPNIDEISKIFSPQKLYDQKFDDIESQIEMTDSVSINIRRGDYLNNKHKSVFVNLSEDYYRDSIKLIRKKLKKPTFYVFSYDDPEWIKDKFNFNDNEIVIMNKGYVGDRFKTYLRLISLCKHNIISNSTFAFWGAFLNKNNHKIVIAPKKWMINASEFEAPESWYLI